jgi:hypothetical protein
MVVGEQHVALEVLRLGAAVMAQPREAEVNTQRIEQGQRLRLARNLPPFAVRDLVADMAQLRGRKMPRQFRRRDVCISDPFADDVSVGDLLGGASDLDLDVVIAEQKVELFGQILREQLRPGYALRI